MPAVKIPIEGGVLLGDFSVVEEAKGIILFAHGSGSSRLSSRNRMVANVLQEAMFSTLLFDLLTEAEERKEKEGEFRFNIDLLAKRLSLAIQWIQKQSKLPIGLFGASTGAAAALKASLHSPIFAIVSRGGRPDLAEEALPKVKAPTLLIVGGADFPVIEMNRKAQEKMKAPVELQIVKDATHLFEERGKLEEVANLAKKWFLKHAP
jgi:putative phosphoribosyl transferase